MLRDGMLDGKVVVVSGVGPGLGRATALACAREGAAVVLTARNEARLVDVAGEIEALGGRALAVPANIARPDNCARVVREAQAAYGRIDVLVNSAFRSDSFDTFEDADLDAWRKIFEVNVWGTLALTQACLPLLKAREGASIVMVASMSARKPSLKVPEGGYAMSKAALLTATRTLAVELAPHRIRVNAVVPGWIWGPNVATYVEWQASARGVTHDEVIAEIVVDIPLGEIPPQEDVAESIVFFASPMSRMITGQALDVNGGEYFG